MMCKFQNWCKLQRAVWAHCCFIHGSVPFVMNCLSSHQPPVTSLGGGGSLLSLSVLTHQVQHHDSTWHVIPPTPGFLETKREDTACLRTSDNRPNSKIC